MFATLKVIIFSSLFITEICIYIYVFHSILWGSHLFNNDTHPSKYISCPSVLRYWQVLLQNAQCYLRFSYKIAAYPIFLCVSKFKVKFPQPSSISVYPQLIQNLFNSIIQSEPIGTKFVLFSWKCSISAHAIQMPIWQTGCDSDTNLMVISFCLIRIYPYKMCTLHISSHIMCEIYMNWMARKKIMVKFLEI